MIATLLLLCGSMLLFLDVAANASGTHGQVAMIGLVLVAIGGSCLWADFFDVTSWFTRESWVTGHVPAGYRRYPRSFTSEAHLRRRTAKPKHTKAMSKRLVPHSLTLTVDIVRHRSVRRFNGGNSQKIGASRRLGTL